MRKFISLILLSIISNASYAFYPFTTEVMALRVTKTGNGLMYPATAIPSPECSQAYVTFDTTTDGGKAIYSMLLSAKISARKVYIEMLEGDGCKINIAQLTNS